MDLNYFVHNNLLNNDEDNVYRLTKQVYELEMGQDDFDQLHPEDQQPWISMVDATLRILQEELLAFNGE